MAINISVDDIFVDESQLYADFTVRLDVASASVVTVRYETNSITASSGNDYLYATNTLTFAVGETVKTVRVQLLNDAIAERTETFGLSLFSASANAAITRGYAVAAIVDNDAAPGTPVVSISSLVVDELTKEASFVITLDRPSTSSVKLNYATQNGTAVAGSDFVATSGALTFAPGETARTVKVALINDSVVEGSEAFNLVLSGLVNATSVNPVGAAIISENDAPVVAKPNISVDNITVGESQLFADFLVKLDAPSASVVTVRYETSGITASSGNDYVYGADTLTFAPGETVKTVRVQLHDDATAEQAETFRLTLFSASANATITRAYAVATIIDNDAPAGTPVVSIGSLVVDELTKEANFVITLDRPSTSVVTLNYATQDGTALAGSDYVATSGTLKFAPGETTRTIAIGLINDSVAEGSEAFNLVLSGLVNATSVNPIGTATINENDAPVVAKPNISVENITVGESQLFADFLVKLDAPSASVVTVRYETGGITASSGNDYVYGLDTLTFAPGETIKTVRVQLHNDTTAEQAETFGLTLFSASANATITRAYAVATIIDNDAPVGTPVVSIGSLVVDEQAKEASFVITLDRPSASTVSLNYATQNGTALAGSDYVTATGTLKFAPGETARTVKVSLINDSVAEGSESFNLVLSGLVNATSVNAVGTATINENDAPVTAKPNISVEDITVGESQLFADFLVKLDAPSASVVTVRYETGGITASSGNDYVYGLDTLTFAAGETVKTVRVQLHNDTTAEQAETFRLTLFSPSANATISRPNAIATIVDNDAAVGKPVVSINDFVIDEATKEASFVITLDRPSSSTVTMSYATQNGMALAGSDYVATSGSLKFAAGETARTVKVSLINDGVAEGSESFNLVLSALVNATSLDAVGTATINENDAPTVAKPNISVEDITVGESQLFADFLVRLDAPSAGVVTVRYETGGITASSGNDYVYGLDTLTFAAGETVKTVRVQLLNDTAAEQAETFRLSLFSPSANATISRPNAIATIIDNDAAAGKPIVSINDFVIDEATKEASFVITLDRPSTTTVTMNYTTQNGTALAGSDYVATSGTLKFAAGETARMVKVALLNDGVAEGPEIFNLALSALSGATSLDPLGTAIIAANDGVVSAKPSITVSNATTLENSSFMDFLVSLSAPSASAITVRYETSGSTASSGNDYIYGLDTLTFAAGETVKTVRVQILNDTAVEQAETFSLTLFSPSANATIARATAIGTIIDNDTTPAPTTTTITASSAADVYLFGTTLKDSITGTAGNDVLMGGQGVDTLTGLAGNDSYIVDTATDVVVEAAGNGTDTIFSSVSYSLPANVENIVLTGLAAINATGNSLDNMLTGNAAANTLNGGTGADTMAGGAGDDVYYVDNVGDVVVEAASAGTDTVRSSLLNYTLGSNVENLVLEGTGAINGTGNSLANVLTGNSAANILKGGDGDDTLNGGAGADQMTGGSGNDIYIVDNVGDTVIEVSGGGTDTVKTSLAAYTLGNDVENLTYTGTVAFTGTGNGLANKITGGVGNDILSGGDGADSLTGGAGGDTMTGGAGADRFIFTAVSSFGTTVKDRITDFSTADGDKIDLATIDANSSVSGDQAFVFIGTAAFTTTVHTKSEIRFEAAAGGDLLVQGDINRDGVADFSFFVQAATLTATDFVL